MCYKPVHINHSSFSPNRLSDDGEIFTEHNGFAVDVPCGHCDQCLSAKRDGYLLRCLAENDRSFSRCFCTLTYDNHNLPYIYQHTQPVWDNNGFLVAPPKRYKRSVWDKTHIQKFLKSLNEKIIYYVGTEVYGLNRLVTINGYRCISSEWRKFLASFARPLKYLCVCERGKNNIYKSESGNTRKGTKRPHYHLIIFNSCEHIDDSKLKDLIKDSWPYGISYNAMIEDNNFSTKRNIRQSISYICKYVTKDLTDTSIKLLYNDHESRLRHTPFVLVSNFLGDNLLSNYDATSLLYHLVHGITIPEGIFSKERVVPIPAYNKRISPMYYYLNDGKHISKSIAKPELFFDGFQVTFIDNYCEYEYRTYYKKYKLLTDFGKKVQELTKEMKSRELFDVLMSIRKDNSIYTCLSTHSLAVGSFLYLDFINNIDPLDFIEYVKSPYQTGDDSSPLYFAYLGVREYMATLSRISHYENELDYNLKFEKIIEKNPEFLCIQPL